MIDNWTSVKSSVVNAVAHKNNHLFVRYSNGSVHSYAGVNETKFQQMLSAPSVGVFLNSSIKPHHASRKL